MVLYDIAHRIRNLTLYLNTDIRSVEMGDKRNISCVVAVVQNAETVLRTMGQIFIDCTGVGIVADAVWCIFCQWFATICAEGTCRTLL